MEIIRRRWRFSYTLLYRCMGIILYKSENHGACGTSIQDLPFFTMLRVRKTVIIASYTRRIRYGEFNIFSWIQTIIVIIIIYAYVIRYNKSYRTSEKEKQRRAFRSGNRFFFLDLIDRRFGDIWRTSSQQCRWLLSLLKTISSIVFRGQQWPCTWTVCNSISYKQIARPQNSIRVIHVGTYLENTHTHSHWCCNAKNPLRCTMFSDPIQSVR